VPDDPCRSGVEGLDQRGEVVGEALDRHCTGDGRAPGALHVGPDHGEALGERRDLGLVEVRRPAEAVDQHDGRTVPRDLDSELLAVDLHAFVLLEGSFSGWCCGGRRGP
jgi:hypothetical protein